MRQGWLPRSWWHDESLSITDPALSADHPACAGVDAAQPSRLRDSPSPLVQGRARLAAASQVAASRPPRAGLSPLQHDRLPESIRGDLRRLPRHPRQDAAQATGAAPLRRQGERPPRPAPGRDRSGQPRQPDPGGHGGLRDPAQQALLQQPPGLLGPQAAPGPPADTGPARRRRKGPDRRAAIQALLPHSHPGNPSLQCGGFRRRLLRPPGDTAQRRPRHALPQQRAFRPPQATWRGTAQPGSSRLSLRAIHPRAGPARPHQPRPGRHRRGNPQCHLQPVERAHS